jgi:quinol monooxygenase YgiN
VNTYRAVAKFKINEGKSEEFRALVLQCVEIVKMRDPGTSSYEWFFNESATEAIVLESYEGEEAFLAHSKNVGALVGQALKLATCTVDMLADPTPEMRAILKRLPMTFYSQFAGIKGG